MIQIKRKQYRKTEKTCKECGLTFVAGGQAKFCSVSCRAKNGRAGGKRKIHSKECTHCGNLFLAEKTTQSLCSTQCRASSKRFKQQYQCEYCKNPFWRRKRGNDSMRYCSRDCAFDWLKAHAAGRIVVLSKPCEDCLAPITPQHMRTRRCDECKALVERRAYKRQLAKSREEYTPHPQHIALCEECGNQFLTARRQSYCNSSCAIRAHKRKWRHVRRTLHKNGDNITLHRLIQRDNGICQLCFLPVDRAANLSKDHAAPTIDHVTPVALGGQHTWDNVQLACRFCNSIKGDGRQSDPHSRGGLDFYQGTPFTGW